MLASSAQGRLRSGNSADEIRSGSPTSSGLGHDYRLACANALPVGKAKSQSPGPLALLPSRTGGSGGSQKKSPSVTPEQSQPSITPRSNSSATSAMTLG